MKFKRKILKSKRKIIYDQKDKFENFAEENPNFVDFVKILNLHMS